MMFGFIFKNLKYLIDAAIIIALLIVFAYWDPFGLFGTKVKTHNTANLVSNISEIGELITAEYYGEVVASWKEGKITQYSQDTISKLIADQYKDLKFALWEIYRVSKDADKDNDLKVRKRKIEDILVEINPEFVRSMVYYDLLRYTVKKQFNIDEDKESDLLWILYNDVADKVKAHADFGATAKYLNDTVGLYAGQFYASFQEAIAEDLFDSRSTRRKNIVFIGRGWVKAGFDFSNLNENNFFYDRDNATVTFLGFEPKILDADINPWFIPENRIKGFELVDYSGKVDFQDAILVKKKCKEKLRDQALGAGILESANENGKTALANFFSLVLGTEIKSVSFLADRYDYLYAEIGKDSLISLEEAMVIEKVYHEEMAVIHEEKVIPLREKKWKNLQDFLVKLKKINYLEKDRKYAFSYFSSFCSRILGSSTGLTRMDKEEMDSIHDLRIELQTLERLKLPDIIKDDSVWFGVNGAYMVDFNDAIELLSQRIEEYDTLITAEYSLADLRFDFRDSLLLADNSKISYICKADEDVEYGALKKIREKECVLIENKILEDWNSLKQEKEKMMGIPYKLGLLQEKIKEHFSPEE